MQSVQTNLCRVLSLNPDYCLLRNAIEEVFPHFHKTQLRDALAGGHSRDLDFTASVLRLEAAVLERDKVCCYLLGIPRLFGGFVHVQGDPSGCDKPPVDSKTKVAY